ncbi:MAG: hypothetical protein C5B43_01745 [Verrucomicrobia bacterium]|nr:MAG: hypothetical protein C5B43_01745 [Verrucomicrobiota bacterium]
MASWGNVKDFSAKHGKVILDGAQTGLDIAGMVPVLGAVPDLLNAGIHTARGQYVEAGLSLAAAVPIVGEVATGAKLASKAYKAANAGKSFTKEAAKELRTMGYQQHHIVPKGHRYTKNHELLQYIDIDIKTSAHNLIWLPSKAGLHPTRTQHWGGHLDEVGIKMSEGMTDILKRGQLGDWTRNQYNKEFLDLLGRTRADLKKGEFKLNNVKK